MRRGGTAASAPGPARTATARPATAAGAGNGGLGLAPGDYGSSNELQNIQAALLGGGLGGSGTGGGRPAGLSGYPGARPGPGQRRQQPRVSTAGGGSNSANRALAKKMAQQMYGWAGSQWSGGLLPLWTPGVRLRRQRPRTRRLERAYGIAQFLDSTWGQYGPKTGNPGLQIKYGLEYIHDRYGSPP